LKIKSDGDLVCVSKKLVVKEKGD